MLSAPLLVPGRVARLVDSGRPKVGFTAKAGNEKRASRRRPFLYGWREWNRTTDPYRVKVVL